MIRLSDEPLDRRNISSELQRSVLALSADIRELRIELVRKDVYTSDQRNTDDKLRAIDRAVLSTEQLVEKIEERRSADRRLLITAFVLPIVLMIFQLYLASQTGGGK